MVEPAQDRYASGMNTWRAGCGGSRTSGSEGGPRKPTGRKTGRAPQSDPYTEHPTREGKVYCAVVLDVHSRRVVGWSIDSSQTAALATNALGMAISNRSSRPAGTVIHSDHGVQFTSWAFTRRARESGLVPSMGSIGDCYDNAVIESFWGRVQTELLDRRRWRTRIELANALFEYLEIFHNRRRRHSALGMLTPIEYEMLHRTQPVA
jgi:transposase InsO family protein